jgi:hypothetical protein
MNRRRPVVFLVIVASAAVAGITTCLAVPRLRASTNHPSVANASSHGSDRSDTAVRSKPQLTGLIDMGVQASYRLDEPFPIADTSAISPYAGSFGGIVVNENWGQLEPHEGHYAWGDLSASLSAVEQWNALHRSAPIGVKLRVFAGNGAPAWAKNIGGPPLSIVSKGVTKSFGRWWSTPYRRAWSAFQHALAAQYDENPLIRGVAVTSCSTLTGEPFVLAMSPPALETMEAAGWTPAAQQRCLEGALADYSGWAHTPITFAFNPYRTVVNDKVVTDDAVTTGTMKSCATSQMRGGPDCVLGNNALTSQAASGGSSPVYAEIAALWPARPTTTLAYFQTASPEVDCAAIDVAEIHHANTVELWPPNRGVLGFSAIPADTLQKWATDLRTRSTPDCSN